MLKLPKEAQQELLNEIAEIHGPLEAPAKPEPTPTETEAARALKAAQVEAEQARVENEARRVAGIKREVIGSLNTLGSDDLAIAKSAIAANIGVHTPVKAAHVPAPVPHPVSHPAPAPKPALNTLSKDELVKRAESVGVEVKSAMTKDDLIHAIEVAEKAKK